MLFCVIKKLIYILRDDKNKDYMAKHKVHYEFPMHCLSEILYEYLATAEGLSEWFADEVTEKGDDSFLVGAEDLLKRPL